MFGNKTSRILLNQTGKSFIGESMQVEGEMHSPGGVDIAGLVKGNVYVEQIIVSETGSVKGDVFANKLIVYGHMEGKIVADTVSLGSNAIVIGDISFKTSLKTEEGADIDGYIRKTKKIAIEKDTDIEEITEKPELRKPTLVKSDKKEIV